jgi:putative ATP-dependent endonuclease of the OLD family
MAVIRHLRIERFRGINTLNWQPFAGVNCLIGPGDSGKSTILEAIDLCLTPRRYALFGEADFYHLETRDPIIIEVTLGELEDAMLDIDTYARFLRGFDHASGQIEDEPSGTLEPVLTLRLEVGDDLIPRWTLFAERAKERHESRDLSARDRSRIAPTRLGAYADTHLAWGQRSILNRFGDERPDAGAALAQARSAAKQAFGQGSGALFDETLEIVCSVARELAVDIGPSAKALLDTQQVSMGNGVIALHDANNVPLRNLGLGSSRLLVAGLQRRSAIGSHIALIDEIEHGLEPYRITQLLHVLGSKAAGSFQLFLTTHSPVVLRELSAPQVVVMRRAQAGNEPHRVLAVGGAEDRQKTLRACAEAFLTPRVLVCEGKTEVGLMRGLDLYWHEHQEPTLAWCGVYAADGGGTEAVNRALVFAELGYETAILRDDDVALSAHNRAKLDAAGIRIFQWDSRQSFEQALMSACPVEAILSLLEIAVETRGEAVIEADIKAVSNGASSLERCRSGCDAPEVRDILAKASVRKPGWFKLIEPGERIGYEVILCHWEALGVSFRKIVADIRQWIREKAIHDDGNA